MPEISAVLSYLAHNVFHVIHHRQDSEIPADPSQEGAPLVLTVVKKAEQAILADPAANHEYLPVGAGFPET